MVARAVSKSKPAFRGIRPFEPMRDLYAVTRLLEEAFRSEHSFPFSDVPIIRQVGVFFWAASYMPVFPENVTGFVWVEDGRIVGNVTITQDNTRLERYLISNVAVKPQYRRQGIARQLTLAALDDLCARGARIVLLNARPNNADALKLYRDLGFQEIEMSGEWRLVSAQGRGGVGEQGRADFLPLGLRSLRSSDVSAAADLIRAATPARVQQYRPRQNEFALAWDERVVEAVTDFFIGQATHRWALECDGKLAGLILVRGQHIASPHRLAIQVHPDWRGRVENALVAHALRDLAQFPPREIRAAATSTHPELIAALEQSGFTFLNGLTLMAREM